jgi:hypothetical protein
MFQSVIDGFEEEYQQERERDNLPGDSSMARAAFYGACLRIVRDGPRMRSSLVQARLVKYYTELRDEEYKKIVDRLT